MTDEPELFADELRAVNQAMMAVSNACMGRSDDGDDNVNPEDEAVTVMMVAGSDLDLAVQALNDSVSEEYRRRTAILDEMEDEDYDALCMRLMERGRPIP